MANDGSMAKRLWEECRTTWTSALGTPFLMALASGELEIQAFNNFASQQPHILECFAQALDKAGECADDDTNMSIGLLTLDIKNHNSVLKNRGFDMTKEYPAYPATFKYIGDFSKPASGEVDGVKLATPFEKSRVAVYTLCLMLPHIQLYNFIGHELRSRARGNNHPYKNWIDYCCSQYFQVSIVLAEGLLQILSVSLADKELDNIQKLYRYGMKLELDFFSAQPMVLKSVPSLLKEYNPSKYHFMIFSDFDHTCTVKGSSPVLLNLSLEKGKNYSQVQSQNQADWNTQKAEKHNRWLLLSKDFKEGSEKYMEKLMAKSGKKISLTDQTTINETEEHEGEKFNFALLKNAFEELPEVVKRLSAGIVEFGLLKGINLKDIKLAGERLILRDGCMSLFKSITKSESISSSIHVLSCCRCDDLIKAAFSSGDLRILAIHANELVYEESVTPTGEIMAISTGEIIRRVESPIDKFELFRKIIEENGSGRGRVTLFGSAIAMEKKLVVYIGDSVEDLLCLVDADIGIVIASNESLREVGRLFGVKFVPLFQRLVQEHTRKETAEGKQSVTLYTVSSWAEIHAFILGS